MAEKSNIQHLRDIIKELTLTNTAKQEEASGFLDALQLEIKEKDDEIKMQEDGLDKLLEEGPEYENSDDVGLDHINWQLYNGNLRIQQEMENFIQALKKKYIGVTA